MPLVKRSQVISKLTDNIFTIICYFSVMMGMFILLVILYNLIKHGEAALSPHIFTTPTLPANLMGGLGNAMLGSLYMVGIAMLISMPLGIFIAIYLTQYNKKGALNKLVRLVNDCLLTTPSIVIGIFVFSLMVYPMHQFSALAGSIALALISLPMIARSAEDVLYLVSPLLQEAALSLGLTQSKVIVRIVLKSALNGMITAVLLALARIAGETAPLLFTSLSSQYYSHNLMHSMASLPIVIFHYAMSPYASWQALAWTGSLIIAVFILLINILARFVFRDH